MLALAANRPVSRERLIDGLWGDEPPASAAKLVQLYISGLRKALRDTDAEIVTHGHGYALRIDADGVDAARLERLLGEATSDAANGHGREALALWRGPPLVDVADEPFAANEIRRLDELWLRAKEAAIDADLEAGRHEHVLGELASLVAEHPLRERIQGQWMLALYRSGRQAEGLEAYRAARDALVDQIGAEPGPELRRLHDAILHQDPALAGPARRRGPAAATAGPRRRLALLAVASLLAAAAVAIVIARQGEPLMLAEDSVGLIDGDDGSVRADYLVGRRPGAIVASADSLWVANTLDGTVTRLERGSSRATTIDVGPDPTALAAGPGSVWVANGQPRTLSQISTTSNKIVQRIALDGEPRGLAIGAGAVWAAMPLEGEVARVALAGASRSRRIAVGGAPSALAVSAGAVWVADEEAGRVLRVDPRTLTPTRTIDVGNGPAGIATGAGALWVANRLDGTLSRIDPDTGVVTTMKIGAEAGAVAAGSRSVWVADGAGATVTRIDAVTGRPAAIMHLGKSPSALALDGRSVWVTALAGPASHRGGTLRVVSAPCPLTTCADPATDHPSQWDMITLAYDGLTGYRRAAGGAGDVLVGALATEVPVPTDGGRRYVFTLRPHLRYSDGGPVRAGDFGPSLERTLRLYGRNLPDYYSAILGAPACVRAPARCDLSRGIVADEAARTITIRLSRPDPELPHKLAQPAATLLPGGGPAHLVEGSALPGTGPYRIVSVDRSGNARLVRNRYFAARPAADRPAGFADEIMFERYEPLTDRLAAVERGDADVVEVENGGRQVSRARLEGLLSSHPGHVSIAPSLGVNMMFINVTARPFDDARVRRAVNLATDRARMVALFGGPVAAEPSCQALPSTLPGYNARCPFTGAANPAGTWSAPDLTAARRLVAASGTRGAPVRVWTDTTKVRFGRYFRTLLRRLGYRTSLRVLPVGFDYFHVVSDSRTAAQIGMFGWLADYPTPSSFFDPIFSCHGRVPRSPDNANPSQLCDLRLDGAVKRALAAGGTAKAWEPAERRLVALAPAVPLATRRRIVLSSDRTGDVQQHPMWGTLLERAWVVG